MFDAHLVESFIAGGIGSHGEHTGKYGAFDALGTDVDDDEGDAGMLQFGGGAATDASIAADDEVVLEFFDHAFVPPLPDDVAELQFDNALGHGADGDEDGADAEDDEEGIEDPAGVRKRMDFAVPHGGHGGEGHVEGVEGWVSVDDGKTHSADGERRGDRQRGEKKSAGEPVHCDLVRKDQV